MKLPPTKRITFPPGPLVFCPGNCENWKVKTVCICPHNISSTRKYIINRKNRYINIHGHSKVNLILFGTVVYLRYSDFLVRCLAWLSCEIQIKCSGKKCWCNVFFLVFFIVFIVFTKYIFSPKWSMYVLTLLHDKYESHQSSLSNAVITSLIVLGLGWSSNTVNRSLIV